MLFDLGQFWDCCFETNFFRDGIHEGSRTSRVLTHLLLSHPCKYESTVILPTIVIGRQETRSLTLISTK